ncbi:MULTISPECIES: hypothetical protein [Pseudomonas]|uniref:Uncharacterized protein n=1 Tax=Pseudomonas haemolytica TaxID=2600065 RepID=A0ABS1H048_9PSED|nr:MULTISPECIES: hypothetical protein [Pseudomonas]MBK3462623.1 hypothetical protein [Pseudomonas haemolytica]MBK3506784.1 hypothetical protein [Pseudomonas sp. MF6747]
MKLTKLVIAIATFATITLSSSAYIATQDVTSAVIVDKAKHSLDLKTNGLHNISVSEAFTIDKSEAAQINFLRCSFARPEFRFSWFCHQMKSDGKMTKNSYIALKDDQEKYANSHRLESFFYSLRTDKEFKSLMEKLTINDIEEKKEREAKKKALVDKVLKRVDISAAESTSSLRFDMEQAATYVAYEYAPCNGDNIKEKINCELHRKLIIKSLISGVNDTEIFQSTIEKLTPEYPSAWESLNGVGKFFFVAISMIFGFALFYDMINDEEEEEEEEDTDEDNNVEGESNEK